MQQYFDLLGLPVTDVVTGYKGVCTSVSFDLYGCVQGLIDPGVDKDTGKRGEMLWFDTKRLTSPEGAQPVMPVPSFENVPGGQDLPIPA